MLQWDLSDTPLASSALPLAVPSEAELFALLVGLLVLEKLSYADLIYQPVAMTHDNIEAVARLMEERIPTLARDVGTGRGLRRRLAQLVGVRVMRSASASES